MTQTQNTRSLYVIATVSVLMSSIIWTAVLANYLEVPVPEEEGIVWQGIIGALLPPEIEHTVTKGSVTKVVEPILTTTHEAAPTPASNTPPNELDQWEIQREYSLQIPAINVRAPVLLPSSKYWNGAKWDLLEEQMQVGLSHGLVAYPHSTTAGKLGSLILAGHSSPPDERAANSNYGSVFRRLPELQKGDEISVVMNGKPVKYAVESARVVPATATAILQQQSDKSILKLITCYPIGTTKDRYVVTATKTDV